MQDRKRKAIIHSACLPGDVALARRIQLGICPEYYLPPVGVRIRDATLDFSVLWLEGHLEPKCHFAFQMLPDLRNNLESSGSSLYECSISYSTLILTLAPRILTTTSTPDGRFRHVRRLGFLGKETLGK
jgi:hypothetical protein